jgi:hypothetical protein
MSYSIEWSSVQSPGIVLVGRHFEASEPEKETQKVALFDLLLVILLFQVQFILLISKSRAEQSWSLSPVFSAEKMNMTGNGGIKQFHLSSQISTKKVIR